MKAAPAATVEGDVLVIDDDAILRDLVGDWLTAAGYKVRKAADCQAALGALADASPALIVCDMFMPGACGAAAIGELNPAAASRRKRPCPPALRARSQSRCGVPSC